MHCVINLNKPKGITSQDAVTKVKRLLNVKKAGHAGTLDPLATGVLLVCLNEATKIAGFLSDMDKEYQAEVKLGEATDTYDSEGKITSKKEGFFFTEAEIDKVLETMRGAITQTPPMYSAIKHKGMPLYALARKGIEVKRQKRVINIHSLFITRFNLPFLELSITCSKGTYIRSLAHDIGSALGVGAHLTGLKRLRIGDFKIEDSASMEELPYKKTAYHTVDSGLRHMKEVILDERQLFLASHGGDIVFEGSQTPFSKDLNIALDKGNTPYLRLKSPDGQLFGIGMALKDSMSKTTRIKIKRLLNLS